MRVAAHQPPATDSVDEALERLGAALRRAEAAGVDLVCFPECYVGGYFPNDHHATDRVAYEVGTPAFDGLLRRIGRFEATLVVGIAERRGAELFNTALVVRQGALIGRYAKSRPNEAFFTAGGEHPTFAAAGTRFGINICNDANSPEVAAATAEAGAQVIVMPLNNLLRFEVDRLWRERHVANLVARARETGCWVVSSDIVGRTAERVAHGCAAIVDPLGRLLARVPEDREGVVTHDLA